MKQTSVIAVTLAAALFLAGVPAVAQHAGHDSATSGAAMSPDMMAQHQKMMAQHQEIGKLIDELARDFSALQNENDPTVQRAIEQRILAMQYRAFQRAFADIVIQRHAGELATNPS